MKILYENLKGKNDIWGCETYVQAILLFYNKKINPNTINVGHTSLDPNLKNFSCQWNNIFEKESNDNESLLNVNTEI